MRTPPDPGARHFPGRRARLARTLGIALGGIGLSLAALPAAAQEATVPVAGTAAVAAGTPRPSVGVWPLDPRPRVVRGFDPPQSRFGTGHRGVDLAGRPGQPVRAAVSGEVTYAGRVGGRGVVVVDHGGTRTTYEPVAAVTRVGDLVRAGSVIGRLQLLGSHCFPAACLHWGLIEGRAHYLDPLTLVGAEPVVLLPLDSGPALAAVPASPVRRAAAGGRAGVEPWTAGTQDAVCRPPLACRPTVILWLFPPDTGLRRGDEPAGRPVVAGPW